VHKDQEPFYLRQYGITRHQAKHEASRHARTGVTRRRRTPGRTLPPAQGLLHRRQREPLCQLVTLALHHMDLARLLLGKRGGNQGGLADAGFPLDKHRQATS